MSRETNGVAKHRRLMVIDDDDLSLSVISLLLKSHGYEVTQAIDGAAAISVLGSMEPEALPSVLLADLRMPGLSGQDLAVALRRVAPQARLLAMSATPASTPGATEGYDGFLKKPFDPAALKEILEGETNAAPTPAIAGTEHPLEEAVYARLAHMMPAKALRETYEACLNDTRARGAEMRQAGEASDLTSVRQTAHTVKGGAGMIGARKLAAAAAELELGAYQKEDIPRLIDNLLSCCDQLELILLTKL
jgi:CheY-like chemotaxis protein